MRGFYEQVILFMRNLFSGGLKDNRHLSYGFLTGILRVAKESIFSGLNNLKVNSILDKRYNGESGDGRYDIQLLPKTADMPGILIELKAAKSCSPEKLKLLSETALKQMDDRKYDTHMAAKGIKTIFKYGVAFSGKQVEVASAGK